MSPSTLPAPVAATASAGHNAPVLDVVVPVHNEENDLEPSVRRLHAHLSTGFPYPFRITVADNASTDRTSRIAAELAAELPEVSFVRLTAKGRGRALKHTWSASDAQILAYMDVDLSTDLAALLPLVAPLITGHSDLAIGSRLSHGSRVTRGPKREIISRCYNLLLRGTLAARFSDAQCGFKAVRADVAAGLLPLVEDTGWFFDTELLVLAERAGLRIHEVPVDWIDDPDSRVDLLPTIMADVRGIARLARALATGSLPLAGLREQLGRTPLPVAGVPAGLPGQLLRFAAVGTASTLAYLLLYALLRGTTGAQAANLVALLVTAVGNTALNRRLTFGVRGPGRWWRQQAQGLIAFAASLALTGGALALLYATDSAPPRPLELGVLVTANLAATCVRFLLLRTWVFRTSRGARED
ncbi:bifunctional glycosyltransferase family 2/GtrA family protein [Nonomuraea glycinis]|uniref:dolichyl-phosphate beta-glucosyltransferase n=1 Tax=Nonomuraea glycinis TaxID=2047744 RepID=A0A918ADJ7_9ACTN|nr:bifunctional glycosyltransferase family 2/GtrA family protein [Nonomuraea glycinis]MCA2181329.1 bifunctional glycosyltransferase family 2/GtrA family protein [Nonomuraea glycinis]GGP14249.1 sugar translocase [Nonomuraea glycinis]